MYHLKLIFTRRAVMTVVIWTVITALAAMADMETGVVIGMLYGMASIPVIEDYLEGFNRRALWNAVPLAVVLTGLMAVAYFKYNPMIYTILTFVYLLSRLKIIKLR